LAKEKENRIVRANLYRGQREGSRIIIDSEKEKKKGSLQSGKRRKPTKYQGEKKRRLWMICLTLGKKGGGSALGRKGKSPIARKGGLQRVNKGVGANIPVL